jgi:alpha-maltose-1-phosphate synthase
MMSRQVLFLAPVLPRDVLATARILEKADLLDSLITRSVARFANRPASPVARERMEPKWMADLAFYFMLGVGKSRTRATDYSFHYLDRLASKRINKELGAVFAREDCCLQTFRRAQDIGIPTIYQLPTAYWDKVRDLMQREFSKFGDICKAATDPNEFSDERTERKEAELKSTNRILCPSRFVRESLPVDRKSIAQTIPFAGEPRTTSAGSKPSKPMFLYVGNITMRKGVHRLLTAWKELKAYQTHELRLVGDMFLSEKFLSDFRGTFTHLQRVSRADLDRHYREASALVFNSVADGFGQVILEAMSVGTPVLASRNSGAADVITDHIDGLLFNYGDEEQFVTALNWALSRPAELAGLGKTAAETARKRTWQDYGDELLAWMRPLLKT